MPFKDKANKVFEDVDKLFGNAEKTAIERGWVKWVIVGLVAVLLLAIGMWAFGAAKAQPFLVSDPAVPIDPAKFDGDWASWRCVYQDGSATPVVTALTAEHACRVNLATISNGAHALKVWFGNVNNRCCAVPSCTGLPACTDGPFSNFGFTRPGPPIAPTTAGVSK